MMRCPICGGRGVGKVGIGQYFCHDCYIEFSQKGNQTKVYCVQDDGTLLQYQANKGEIIEKIS